MGVFTYSTGTGSNYVLTFSTASGATATYTYTITWPVGTSKEPEKPEPEKSLEDLFANMKFTEPELLPPKRYGSCGRCCVEVDYDAFDGTCSVCGRMLTMG